MAGFVGTIKSLEGTFYAQDANGRIRELKVGDEIFQGERVLAGIGNSSENEIEILVDANQLLSFNADEVILFDTIANGASVGSNDEFVLDKAWLLANNATLTETENENASAITDEETAAGDELETTDNGVFSFDSRVGGLIDIQAFLNESVKTNQPLNNTNNLIDSIDSIDSSILPTNPFEPETKPKPVSFLDNSITNYSSTSISGRITSSKLDDTIKSLRIDMDNLSINGEKPITSNGITTISINSRTYKLELSEDGKELVASASSMRSLNENEVFKIVLNDNGTWTLYKQEDFDASFDISFKTEYNSGETDSTTVEIDKENIIDSDDVNEDGSIHGTEGNDIIQGSNTQDTGDIILGGLGNDYIDGGDGPDFIDGGAGDDTLVGGAGSDTIKGGTGNDFIIADTSDIIDGGEGVDTLKLLSTDGINSNGINFDNIKNIENLDLTEYNLDKITLNDVEGMMSDSNNDITIKIDETDVLLVTTGWEESGRGSASSESAYIVYTQDDKTITIEYEKQPDII